MAHATQYSSWVVPELYPLSPSIFGTLEGRWTHWSLKGWYHDEPRVLWQYRCSACQRYWFALQVCQSSLLALPTLSKESSPTLTVARYFTWAAAVRTVPCSHPQTPPIHLDPQLHSHPFNHRAPGRILHSRHPNHLVQSSHGFLRDPHHLLHRRF